MIFKDNINNEKFVTKKEFAKIAHKSVPAIDTLIREGRIIPESNGKINLKYLNIFIEADIRSMAKSFLYLYPVPIEIYNSMDKNIDLPYEGMFKIESMANLLNIIGEKKLESLEGMIDDVTVIYRRELLKAFITRYLESLSHHVSTLVSSLRKIDNIKVSKTGVKNEANVGALEVASIPIGVIWSFYKFGTTSEYIDYKEDLNDTQKEILSGGIGVGGRKKSLDDTFEDMMKSFGLIDIVSGDLLFKRDELNQDFYDFKGELFDSIVTTGKTPAGKELSIEPTTPASRTIKENVHYCSYTKCQAEVISSIKSKGFYMISNAGIDMRRLMPDTALRLIEAINEGYFSKIYVMSTKEAAEVNCSESILNALDTARAKYNIEVKYLEA